MNMKTAILAFAIAASIAAPAAAQDTSNAQSYANQMKGLTVNQVLAIGDAIRMLGDYPEMVPGPNGSQPSGKMVSVPFRFPGGTMMKLAQDVGFSEQVRATYRVEYNKLVAKFSGGKPTVPVDKMGDFNVENDQLTGAPVSVLMARFKMADFCLNNPPVDPCKVTNAISPGILGAIAVLIDE